ncbi:hypothetical protein Poli38472_005498 [Pythium oligandrum]|uniref:Large ribosomal subunit protein bL32m n=1 Tax=Pythium oligandrum TaxID=41045 RepID=A0A8K1FGK9_PYTOL|nr:hypothetical protein Poli38472_005498 [Pythium oligandrum]|eukprot:TMW62880.1 hypothetical protein Poli38472_005498 [Pythium oligandrum]
MALMQRVIQRALAYFHGTTPFTPSVAAIAMSGAAAAPAPATNTLLDAIWLAAPKSKVTPSRKKIRNNDPSKRLKNIVHFQDCALCGEKKLRHRLCMSCFKKGKYFV